jgi:hypothetical protein
VGSILPKPGSPAPIPVPAGPDSLPGKIDLRDSNPVEVSSSEEICSPIFGLITDRDLLFFGGVLLSLSSSSCPPPQEKVIRVPPIMNNIFENFMIYKIIPDIYDITFFIS